MRSKIDWTISGRTNPTDLTQTVTTHINQSGWSPLITPLSRLIDTGKKWNDLEIGLTTLTTMNYEPLDIWVYHCIFAKDMIIQKCKSVRLALKKGGGGLSGLQCIKSEWSKPTQTAPGNLPVPPKKNFRMIICLAPSWKMSSREPLQQLQGANSRLGWLWERN